MRVAVLGLWHLGSVTAACLAAAGVATIGIDSDVQVIDRLRAGRAPPFEPGLDDLLAGGLASKCLEFSDQLAAVADADVVWIAYDTPVDDADRADVEAVTSAVEDIFPYLHDSSVVLISSQLPVGTTQALAQAFSHAYPDRDCHFAYSPENLRLGSAIQSFTQADRIVVGVSGILARERLEPLLSRYSDRLVWVSVEAAEMVKHAVNAFLAMSVTFANEIASICERVGADASEVEGALRLEARIGPKAYIRPGAAFAGGTLARDVTFLNGIAEREGLSTPLIASVVPSNHAHKTWPIRRLIEEFNGDLRGRRVAVLGLVYKAGTSTLRRSFAVEMCAALVSQGADVVAFDPTVQSAPAGLGAILASSALEALEGADAVIVSTEWPEFRYISGEAVARLMRGSIVIDPNRFLVETFVTLPHIRYLSVGKP